MTIIEAVARAIDNAEDAMFERDPIAFKRARTLVAIVAVVKNIADKMDARIAIAKSEFERGFPDKDCSTINSTLAYGRIQGFENARAMLDQAIKEIDHD